jgi:hypothetical protein
LRGGREDRDETATPLVGVVCECNAEDELIGSSRGKNKGVVPERKLSNEYDQRIIGERAETTHGSHTNDRATVPEERNETKRKGNRRSDRLRSLLAAGTHIEPLLPAVKD